MLQSRGIILAYISAAALAGCTSYLLNIPTFYSEAPALLSFSSSLFAHFSSLLLGLTLGLAIVSFSRFSVNRYSWAKLLHEELRPFARSRSPKEILGLALSASLAEELIFRGLLQHFVGFCLQAPIFGFFHQSRGPHRWIWATWAAVVGLLFGLIVKLTGSLLGPFIAHTIVNALNMAYLRDHSTELSAKQTPLGGLLRSETVPPNDHAKFNRKP